MHIEYSTYQFSEKSKGGEVESTPPRSLRYRKKRGPERVKGGKTGKKDGHTENNTSL